MKTFLFNWLIAITVAISSFSVHAGPMGFKDSWMMMGDMSANWRETFINYAFTPRDAFGASTTYMRSDDETKTRDLNEVTYTRLLQRWNEKDSQANVWFVSGIGSMRIDDQHKNDHTETAISPGVQFDYETTRVYFAATERLYRASGINHDFSSVRTGFSFYEPHYDETQPWFILEARQMNDLSDKTEITPMIRLINKTYFVEFGVNNSSDPRFNFMYIF